jgi:hypothetical protein
MTQLTLDHVLARLRARAEEDTEFADALAALAQGDDGDADPFERPSDLTLATARTINRRRQQQRGDVLRTRSLTTRQVVELIGSISDRKAVDRRRQRRKLLGIAIGGDTMHPAWQFDRRRGETHEGLDQVLAALAEVAADPIDADAIATAAWPDLGGRSIADLLAAGDVALAVQVARRAGDQS